MKNEINQITQGVSERIPSPEIALQFILEELDAARQGNIAAEQFVKNSGFSPVEYEGAMQNSFDEVDGANGPQQFLLTSVSAYSHNIDLLVHIRLSVAKEIIRIWQVYALTESRISTLMESLKNILEEDSDVMPELSSTIPVPKCANQCHIVFRRRHIDSAKGIITILKNLTGDDSEDLIRKSLAQ